MGRPAGWMQKLTGRGAMRSPGAPSHRREIERFIKLAIRIQSIELLRFRRLVTMQKYTSHESMADHYFN